MEGGRGECLYIGGGGGEKLGGRKGGREGGREGGERGANKS